MATANELFAANGEDYIVIDSDLRTMTFPASVNNIGVENDKDVHKLNFKMPRYFSGYDLSEFTIHINYVNANGDADMYYVLDPTVEENEIIFSWLVGRHACLYRGSVTFIVCLKLADGEGDVAQEYNTTLASLQVLPGLETEPTILETEHDIIEQLLLSINDTNAKIKAVLDTGLTPEQIAEFYNRSKNYGTEITSVNNNLGYGGFGVTPIKSYKLIEHNATVADFTNSGWYRLGSNDFDDTMKSAVDGTTFPMTQKDYYVQVIGTDFGNGARYAILNVYTPRHDFFVMGRIWNSSVYHWEKAPLRSEFDALNSDFVPYQLKSGDDIFTVAKTGQYRRLFKLAAVTGVTSMPSDLPESAEFIIEILYDNTSRLRKKIVLYYYNNNSQTVYSADIYDKSVVRQWVKWPTRAEVDDLNSILTQRTRGIVTSRGVDMNQHKTYKIIMASGEAYPIFFMYGQATGSTPFAMVISAGNMFSETPTINYNAFVGSDAFSGVTASNGVITVEFTGDWAQFTIISKHKFTDEIV